MQQAVDSWLQTLDHGFFYARIQALVPWWIKCLNVNGEYVEVECVSSATDVPCINCSQNKVLGIKTFVCLISETLLCTVDEMLCLNIMADDTHTYHKL